MTSGQAQKLMAPSPQQERLTATLHAAWTKRKKWTRTDTARHLNDRAQPLLALFRRVHPAAAPQHSAQFGYWLKDNAPALFDRAHARLASATSDEVRAQMLPTELLL